MTAIPTVGSGGSVAYGHAVDPDKVDTSHGPILYLDDITVSFDGFKALNKLSLTIERGELRCIIGPNGAGKTTMMDVITGKTRPDLGTAFFGQTFDLTRLPETEIARLGIGRKFQKPTVFERHTVFENLELAMKSDKRVKPTLFARLTDEQRDLIARTLKTIRLDGEVDRLAGLLSHGQKQWLEIGMLLVQEPELVLLDEPVAGMTDAETERTAELILELEGQHSIVVVEHDMDFIGKIARKVTCLHEGSVLAEGSMDAVAERRARDRGLSGQMRRATGIAMLTIEKLNQYYGGSHILRDVTLDGAGEPAPCCSAATASARRRCSRPSWVSSRRAAAASRLGDTDITRLAPDQRVRLGIGYVPQGREIFNRLTVEENLLMGLAPLSGRQARRIPEDILETFPVLRRCSSAAAAIFPAASSSSWRSAARSLRARRC